MVVRTVNDKVVKKDKQGDPVPEGLALLSRASKRGIDCRKEDNSAGCKPIVESTYNKIQEAKLLQTEKPVAVAQAQKAEKPSVAAQVEQDVIKCAIHGREIV